MTRGVKLGGGQRLAGRGAALGKVVAVQPLDRLVEAFGDLVVIRNVEGRILHANAAFAEVTGCSDPVGRLFLDFCAARPEEDGDSTTVIALKTSDGARTYDWRELAGRDPETGGTVIHALGRDLTPRRLAERDLIAERQRAESLSAAKSRFLAMVSHEVRTPLNGILGIAQLLAGTRLTREQESYVEAMRHSGHALLALIEDLLDFSSMEAGRFHLRPAVGDLRALVGGVVELSAARADEKGIEIAAHVAPDLPEAIVADHGRLRQVLFNLIGNAVKFTEEGGVLVEVLKRGDRLLFRVTDSGPGIGEADRQRIFREFEQVDRGPTRRKDGAGLGLAISARLVAAMGGTLALESAAEKGSTFLVDVPLQPDGASGQAAEPRRLAASRVLLVAPAGPTSEALVRFIRDEGGTAEAAVTLEDAGVAVARLGGADRLTDIIVDNRVAALGEAVVAGFDSGLRRRLGRTMMVTPAERDALTSARARNYSAWLIRPLRPASVVRVLRREIGGLGGWLEERRPAEADFAVGGRAATPVPARPLEILLAEDNAVNALLVRAALERAGHGVVHVADGESLVEKAYDRTRISTGFDVILTDLSMPKMDGVAAIVAIRDFERQHSLKPLPMLVLSADGQRESRAKALENGADDYVEKPVDPAVLLQAVEHAAGRQRQIAPAS